MAGRNEKKPRVNIRWKQKHAATIGLGCTLPASTQESVMGKSGQFFGTEETKQFQSKSSERASGILAKNLLIVHQVAFRSVTCPKLLVL